MAVPGQDDEGYCQLWRAVRPYGICSTMNMKGFDEAFTRVRAIDQSELNNVLN